jgi:hypothetical protein
VSRPRALLHDADPTTRLRAVAVLRGHWDITAVDGDEPLLKAARRLRPDIALVAVPRFGARTALRLVRVLKTEPNQTWLVGALDRSRRVSDPLTALEEWLADGYLGGAHSDADLLAFARDLHAGQRPVRAAAAEGWLDRLRRR